MCEETGLKWPNTLPLTLIHIKSTVNKKHTLSPYEIVMGKPIGLLHTPHKPLHQSTLQMTDDVMLNYCEALNEMCEDYSLTGKRSPSRTCLWTCHSWEPGDLGLAWGDPQTTEDQQNGTHKDVLSSKSWKSLYHHLNY